MNEKKEEDEEEEEGDEEEEEGEEEEEEEEEEKGRWRRKRYLCTDYTSTHTGSLYLGLPVQSNQSNTEQESDCDKPNDPDVINIQL